MIRGETAALEGVTLGFQGRRGVPLPPNRKSIRAPVNFRNARGDFASSAAAEPGAAIARARSLNLS